MDEKTNWTALRNQAAVAAMQGTITILGSSDRSAFREVVVEGFRGAKKTFPNEIAQFAVACADSLIAELKKDANAELSQPVTKSGDKDDFIPVGETFELEGERFKCVETEVSCEGCAFYEKNCGKAPTCSYSLRDDGKEVIFKKLEENND